MITTHTSQLANQSSRGQIFKSRLNIVGQRPQVSIVLDKFLLLSIGLGGALAFGLGMTLWLIRAGIVAPIVDYQFSILLHRIIGLNIFFGLAITGFILQSAPRLFGISMTASWAIVVAIALGPLVSFVCLIVGAPLWIFKVFAVVGPLLTAFVLVLRQKKRALKPHSLFVLLSLFGFFLSAIFLEASPQVLLALVWLGVGAALLGTSHLFVVNLLGGRHVPDVLLYFLLAATALIAVLLWSGFIQLAAILGMFSLLGYATALDLFSVEGGTALLRFGFKSGIGWAVLAFGFLYVRPWQLDGALHMLVLGWAIPILFVLSLHITSVLAGLNQKAGRLSLYLLVAWQIVPIVRSFYLAELRSQGAFMLVGSVVALFWSYWLLALFKRTRVIMTRAPGVVS